MRFLSPRERRRSVTVEIAPMVDVVFLLIIFFMTTAQFARMTRADIDLPIEKGEQDPEHGEAGLVINITRDGEVLVSDRRVDLIELDQLVKAEVRREAPGQAKLMIRADRDAPAERLNRVVSLIESLGVGVARLATEVP